MAADLHAAKGILFPLWLPPIVDDICDALFISFVRNDGDVPVLKDHNISWLPGRQVFWVQSQGGGVPDVYKRQTILSAPATPAPTTQDGMTRNGSAAAKGIAPSVIKQSPMI